MRIGTSNFSVPQFKSSPVGAAPNSTGEPTETVTLSVGERINQLEAKADKFRNIGDGIGVTMFVGFPLWAFPACMLAGSLGFGEVGTFATMAAVGGGLIAASVYAGRVGDDYRQQAQALRDQSQG